MDRKPDLEVPLVAALSADPSLEILERTKLQNVIDERQLIDLAASGKLRRLGNLIGAEGLLLIETLPVAKSPPRRTLRLISTKDGICRFVTVIPKITAGTPDFKNWTDWISHAIHSKLGDLATSAHPVTPVSLLNIRAATDSSENRQAERAISRLLEQTLGEDPDLQVLERRALSNLGFERSLDAVDSLPLKTGAVLIDGTFQPNASGDRMEIKIRVRTEGGAKSQHLELQAESDPLKAVAEVHRGLRKALGVDLLESPIHLEAAEFLAEAKWAFRNELADESLEALAAAEALGIRTAELFALRGKAACEALGENQSAMRFSNARTRDTEEREALIQIAFESLADYTAISGKAHPDFSYQLLDQASRFLAERDEAGDKASSKLRLKLRELSGMNLIDANAMPGLVSAAKHASTWAEDGTELIAFYDLLFRSNHKWISSFFRYLPKSRDAILGTRFRKDPATLVAWDQLTQELLADPKTRARMLFLLGVKNLSARQKEFYPKFLKVLAQDAKTLALSGNLKILLENDDVDLMGNPDSPYHQARAELLIHLLETLPDYEAGLQFLALRTKVPAELHPRLETALSAYWIRARGDELSDIDRKNRAWRLADLLDRIRTYNPGISVGTKPAGLIVKTLWHPFDIVSPEVKSFLYGDRRFIVEGNNVWVSCYQLKNEVLQISLPDFATRSHSLQGFALGWAGNKLLVESAESNDENPRLVRYDPVSEVRVTMPLMETGKLLSLGDRIFCYKFRNSLWEISQDVPPKLIYSVRRRPAENPLEDRANPTHTLELLWGYQHQPVIAVDEGLRQFGGGWEIIQKIPYPKVFPMGEESVVWNGMEGTFLYGPTHEVPLRLLNGKRSPNEKTEYGWKDPGSFYPRAEFAWRAKELFRLETDKDGTFLLRWWSERGPAEGLLVPLSWQMSPMIEQRIIKASESFDDHYNLERLRKPKHLNLYSTPSGLVLAPGAFGFWLISNAELEGWRRQSGAEKPTE